MYKHCTTEEGVLRQRQLELYLMDLMQTVPFPQITVGHLCQQADISRKSFYRYFGSKEGCLYALIDHTLIDGAAHYLPEADTQTNTREIYRRFFSYWLEMKPLLDALDRNNLSLLLVDRMILYLNTEEHDLQRYLGGKENHSSEQLLFMISGIMGLLLNWYKNGYDKSVSQMVDIMEKVLQN